MVPVKRALHLRFRDAMDFSAMSRISAKSYQRRTMFAMTIYVALLLLVWPLARDAGNPWLKLACALAPVVPVLYVIALMARKVMQSDELEQRTHLIGLGVATAVVSVFSLIGGFLAAAKVLPPDAASVLLLWIFPVLVVAYSSVRGWVARRYGSDSCGDEGSPFFLRLLLPAALVGAVAAYAEFIKHDEYLAGIAAGMASAFVVVALFLGLRRWARARHARG